MIAAWIAANDAAETFLASTRQALRSVQIPGRRLWLVRPETAEAVGAVALVLFDRLPGLLVAAAQGLGRHV
jgi:hypothetical protein